MGVWDLHRYAVLNSTVLKHQVAFPAHDRKWVDPRDKGACQNVANYIVSSGRGRRRSSLAREFEADITQPPKSSHAAPVATVQLYATYTRSALTSRSSIGLIEELACISGERRASSRDRGGKDAAKRPTVSVAGRCLSTGAASLVVGNKPVGTGPRFGARKKGSKDSKMAIKTFWDSAFKVC